MAGKKTTKVAENVEEVVVTEFVPYPGEVKATNLNVRKEATIESEVVAIIKSGDIVTIVGEEIAGFYPINFNNITGYVMKDFIIVK